MDDLKKRMMIDGELSDGRRRQPTKYTPPKKGEKMQALYAINLMRLSGGAKTVAMLLIWHANNKTGRCDPGRARLAHESGLDVSTVTRALAELVKAGVLMLEDRGSATNAYHIDWQFLSARFEEFEQRARG